MTTTHTAPQTALPFVDTHHDPGQLSVFDALADLPTTAEKARRAPEPSCCGDYDGRHVEHENIDPQGVGDVVVVCDGCGRVSRTAYRERVYL